MRQLPGFSPPPETLWSIIRGNKLAVAAAVIIGALLPFALKYLFAAILIAFLIAGNQ